MIEDRICDTPKMYIYWSIAFVLILITGFRPVGMDNDSSNYEMYFSFYDNPLYELSAEPLFLFLCKIFNKMFHDVHGLFLVFAAVSMSMKFYILRKLTPLVFLALAVYMGNYFILHEFTQIRAAVASSFLLISIIPLSKGERWKATGFMLCALAFHYSSIIMFPLLALSCKEMSAKQRLMWAMIVPLGYLFYFLNISISSLPIPYIGEKIERYQELASKGDFDQINVFNLVYLVQICIYLYLLYMYDLIKDKVACAPIMLKMMGLSLFSFCALKDLPVLSFRVSEMYGVISIILFCGLYYTVRPGWLGKLIVVFIGWVLFLINVFYSKILELM